MKPLDICLLAAILVPCGLHFRASRWRQNPHYVTSSPGRTAPCQPCSSLGSCPLKKWWPCARWPWLWLRQCGWMKKLIQGFRVKSVP